MKTDIVYSRWIITSHEDLLHLNQIISPLSEFKIFCLHTYSKIQLPLLPEGTPFLKISFAVFRLNPGYSLPLKQCPVKKCNRDKYQWNWRGSRRLQTANRNFTTRERWTMEGGMMVINARVTTTTTEILGIRI